MLLKKLYRQKFRLLLGIVVGTACLHLGFPVGPVVREMPFAQSLPVAIVLSSLGTSVILLMAILIHPYAVRIVEVASLPSLFFALLGRMAPQLDPFAISSVHGFAIFAFASFLSLHLLYGNVLDIWTAVDGPIFSGRVRIDGTAEEIWRVLIPAPGHEDDFIYPGTTFMMNPGSADTEWIASFSVPTPSFSPLTKITLYSMEPGRHIKFGVAPANPVGIEKKLYGWYAMEISPAEEGGNWVDVEMQALNVPLRIFLEWLLGDLFNAHLAEIKEGVECRVTARQSQRKALQDHPLARRN